MKPRLTRDGSLWRNHFRILARMSRRLAQNVRKFSEHMPEEVLANADKILESEWINAEMKAK